MTTARHAALWAATVLAGLSAGFFFAYEASVTIGLAELGDVTYVETFQSINATIRNPAFGSVFFGAPVALAVAVGLNWAWVTTQQRVLLGVALGLYLAGMAVTGIGNVPLNERLADADVLTPAAALAARSDFEAAWNRLNLVRTVAIGASFVALVAASASIGHRNALTASQPIGETASS